MSTHVQKMGIRFNDVLPIFHVVWPENTCFISIKLYAYNHVHVIHTTAHSS